MQMGMAAEARTDDQIEFMLLPKLHEVLPESADPAQVGLVIECGQPGTFAEEVANPWHEPVGQELEHLSFGRSHLGKV